MPLDEVKAFSPPPHHGFFRIRFRRGFPLTIETGAGENKNLTETGSRLQVMNGAGKRATPWSSRCPPSVKQYLIMTNSNKNSVTTKQLRWEIRN